MFYMLKHSIEDEKNIMTINGYINDVWKFFKANLIKLKWNFTAMCG
jgi:hypothetical protein